MALRWDFTDLTAGQLVDRFMIMAAQLGPGQSGLVAVPPPRGNDKTAELRAMREELYERLGAKPQW